MLYLVPAASQNSKVPAEWIAAEKLAAVKPVPAPAVLRFIVR